MDRRSIAYPRALIALLAGSLLVLALAAPVAATHSRPDRAVPIAGYVGGADTFSGPGDCPLDEGVPASWRYTSYATGYVSHLGSVSVVVTHCTWNDDATGTGYFKYGSMTFTAANGDMLLLEDWGTYVVVLGPSGPLSIVDMSWTVAGGTGRFASAQGSGHAAPISDILGGTTYATVDGMLAYDASDRAN